MDILIVGAGPTGLTAALELWRRGFAPRLIDRKKAPSPLSRAVGINPRSLEILEPSGAAAALLRRGIKIFRGYIHENGKIIGAIRPDILPHRYNFLLALPQNETEEILSARLQSYGGRVEYNAALEALAFENGKARAAMRTESGESEHIYDLVIGADGVHSRVRQALDIPFEGFDYSKRWSIADFGSADWPWPAEHVHLFLRRDGIAVVVPIGPERFRAVVDEPESLPHIPVRFTPDPIYRTDDFIISVRQAAAYQKECVYLAGDAAHVHSPVGGRGMNLGIEDSWDLARRIAEGGLEDYTRDRKPAGRETIRLTERLVRMVTLRSPAARLLRRGILGLMMACPSLQKPLLKSVAGISSRPRLY